MPKTKTSSKTKKALRNRTRLEWVLFAALLLIAFLLMASRYEWWPWSMADNNLGSAFYTARKVPATATAADTVSPAGTASGGGTTTTTRTSGSTSTSNTSTGGGSTNGGGSSNGGGGSGGGGGGSGGGDTSTPSPLLSLAAGINTGDTPQQIAAKAYGLNANCAVVVDLPLGLGRQEVCLYRQNGLTVTVTYLNGRVISAALTGQN